MIVFGLLSFAVTAIGCYYALLAQGALPPCGYFIHPLFTPCDQPIRSDRGWCDAKVNCQPYYTCYSIQTICFAEGPPYQYWPKRVTERLWLLGTCNTEGSANACPVCPSPCRYVCAAVWAARDRVDQMSGQVIPCGDRCQLPTWYPGPYNACY
ncbi:MAG: hypothetical protein KatS3mg109_1223 [Pirellulaceae bacterium]|nr:MAG: hypothetical protein KatS3mg109_1223 [Pirellulaceae bacterium]GIW94851.1 MAG: hypothetical protein KatS3mg110_2892 [Pirellulaceae bacterium]